MKDLMIQLVELIHLMNNLYRMAQDDVCNYFYMIGHFYYYHHYSQCGGFLDSIPGLIIQFVELIHLMDDLCEMILDDFYNCFYLTGHFYHHPHPQWSSFLIQSQLVKDLMIQL